MAETGTATRDKARDTGATDADAIDESGGRARRVACNVQRATWCLWRSAAPLIGRRVDQVLTKVLIRVLIKVLMCAESVRWHLAESSPMLDRGAAYHNR